VKLLLKDREFELESGTLGASISDPYWSTKYDPKGDPSLCWSLEFKAKGRVFDGERWKPKISCDILRFPIRRWFEIEGQEVSWDSPFEEKSGEPNGNFYVFEHADIAAATLHFVERDKLRFRVTWQGRCNVFWNDEYGEDVPFSLEGWAEFKRVRVKGSERDTEKALRARLESYLYAGDFDEQPMKVGPHSYEDGVKMAEMTFVPRSL
jgi:hypothetical protein